MSCDLQPQPLFTSLPIELVGRVLCFLGPRDVVRLRLVSRLFHDITYDPVVWRSIYTAARLPRPSGPFPSQPVRFLEQTLLRSERLAEFWTTQPIQAISTTQIRLAGSPLGPPRIIGGRWLVTFESYKQIIFHDIETRTRQVVWECSGMITSWDICSIVSSEGFLVYVVFRDPGGEWRVPWKLLEFKMHEETGHLSQSLTLDIPSTYVGQSACFVGGKAPFLYIMGQHLVFDTRTKIFYQFPRFDSDLVDMSFITPLKVLLTSTYILVVSHRPLDLHNPSTLIQVFAPPADPQPGSNGACTLRLTHEGTRPNCFANLALIRNSIINPVTESTSLRFLRLISQRNCVHFSSVDFTLPKPHSSDVLPISVDVNDVFTVVGGMYDPFMFPYGYHIEASDDGHARGFCRSPAGDQSSNTPCLTKFTVDAIGDRCVAVVGQGLTPRWIHKDHPPCFSMLAFDGVFGRFCYIKNGYNWRLHGFVDATVIDIM
ncbi:hypothetical protein JVU11DRAFT_8630 [Chiua virens]|nr:hypothetical protein JVU11DRAFT_8630 [Chiua virens]